MGIKLLTQPNVIGPTCAQNVLAYLGPNVVVPEVRPLRAPKLPVVNGKIGLAPQAHGWALVDPQSLVYRFSAGKSSKRPKS